MKTERTIELTKKLTELKAKKDSLKKLIDDEKRTMTPEEKKLLGDLLTEIQNCSDELELETREALVEESLNRAAAQAIRPEVGKKDDLQSRFIHLPQQDERYSNLAEFVRDVIDSDSRQKGTMSRKLRANMEMARASGMSESSPTDGGFLVQPDQSARLIEPLFAPGADAILSRVNTTNVTGNSLTFNAIDEDTQSGEAWGGITAYWLGEGSQKTASSPKLRKVELKLKKVAGLCYLTDELMEDTNALSQRLERGFQLAIRRAVVRAIIRGSGAGQPLGLLSVSSTSPSARIEISAETGQLASTIVTENILNMFERLTPGAIAPVWLYNKTCYKQLFQLQVGLGTAGALVSGQSIASTGMTSMLGIPMVECPACSVLGTSGDIILTDLGQYEFIQKGGPQVAYSIHVKFIYDETAMRIVYRCDGQPAAVRRVTLEDGSTTAAPIITLATRA